MIDPILAKRLIEKIASCTEYNVNIMDEQGIIIASKNPSRVGTFHEVAFQIVQGEEDTIIVDSEDSRMGIKKGVNMAIYYKKRKEGVIGITGEPDEVKGIALAIKLAVEVMLEHEIFKYETMKRRNMKEQFLSIMLYRDELEEEEIKRYTVPLQLKEDIIRIPILIHMNKKEGFEEKIINVFLNSKSFSQQDLICHTSSGDIFLYKAVKGSFSELIREYKYIVGEAISEGLRYMRNSDLTYTVYVGSFQSEFRFYRMGYEQCVWMKRHMEKGGSFYFYEHTARYFMSVLPMRELQVAYYTLEKQLDESFVKLFKEVIGALMEANYNLQEAGELLYIHKNTLVYRLNKIRETLYVDPIGNSRDREFVSGLFSYLKRKEKIYNLTRKE